MAQVLKCDITGEADVPMLRVGTKPAILLEGTLTFQISIEDKSDGVKDVSEKYVLDELIKLLNHRRNELNKIEPVESSQGDGITKL